MEDYVWYWLLLLSVSDVVYLLVLSTLTPKKAVLLMVDKLSIHHSIKVPAVIASLLAHSWHGPYLPPTYVAVDGVFRVVLCEYSKF